MNVYLLDTVTGSLKLSHTHKRVKPPVHVVLAENWIVVSVEIPLTLIRKFNKNK